MAYWDPPKVSKKPNQTNKPTGTRNDYFKISMHVLVALLLPLADARTWRCQGAAGSATALSPRRNNKDTQVTPLPKCGQRKTHSNWFDAGTERGTGHRFLKRQGTKIGAPQTQKRCWRDHYLLKNEEGDVFFNFQPNVIHSLSNSYISINTLEKDSFYQIHFGIQLLRKPAAICLPCRPAKHTKSVSEMDAQGTTGMLFQ